MRQVAGDRIQLPGSEVLDDVVECECHDGVAAGDIVQIAVLSVGAVGCGVEPSGNDGLAGTSDFHRVDDHLLSRGQGGGVAQADDGAVILRRFVEGADLFGYIRVGRLGDVTLQVSGRIGDVSIRIIFRLACRHAGTDGLFQYVYTQSIPLGIRVIDLHPSVEITFVGVVDPAAFRPDA